MESDEPSDVGASSSIEPDDEPVGVEAAVDSGADELVDEPSDRADEFDDDEPFADDREVIDRPSQSPSPPPSQSPAPMSDDTSGEAINDELITPGDTSTTNDETEDDSSARIQSLLAMEDEEPQEMTLNLSGGSVDDNASTEDLDADDSMESLLASAKEEIESKKKKDEEDDDDERDILDDLIDDDELPSPGATASTFDVPQPDKKKKKKGFISKFFGGDDD